MLIEAQSITIILGIVLSCAALTLYIASFKLRKQLNNFIFYIVTAVSLTLVSGAIFMCTYGVFRFVDLWPIITVAGMAASLSLVIKAIVDVLNA